MLNLLGPVCSGKQRHGSHSDRSRPLSISMSLCLSFSLSLKKKDKTLPVNYRPISLLPIIAKLLDTLINQLMYHLTTHNIISPTQYAFRPHSSTTSQYRQLLTISTSIGGAKPQRWQSIST